MVIQMLKKRNDSKLVPDYLIDKISRGKRGGKRGSELLLSGFRIWNCLAVCAGDGGGVCFLFFDIITSDDI